MTATLSPQERGKRAAGEAAAALVADGMRLGLGTGSTAAWFVKALAARNLSNLRCVPTSEATADLARSLGLPLTTLEDVSGIDLTVDGADEVGPGLALIKGGGAALLREKLVWEASDRCLVIADAAGSKRTLDDVATEYERLSGRTPRHLLWFTVFAALRYAIVSVRTTKRGVHFGQQQMPEDLDDLVMHRAGLERLLADSARTMTDGGGEFTALKTILEGRDRVAVHQVGADLGRLRVVRAEAEIDVVGVERDERVRAHGRLHVVAGEPLVFDRDDGRVLPGLLVEDAVDVALNEGLAVGVAVRVAVAPG